MPRVESQPFAGRPDCGETIASKKWHRLMPGRAILRWSGISIPCAGALPPPHTPIAGISRLLIWKVSSRIACSSALRTWTTCTNKPGRATLFTCTANFSRAAATPAGGRPFRWLPLRGAGGDSALRMRWENPSAHLLVRGSALRFGPHTCGVESLHRVRRGGNVRCRGTCRQLRRARPWTRAHLLRRPRKARQCVGIRRMYSRTCR